MDEYRVLFRYWGSDTEDEAGAVNTAIVTDDMDAAYRIADLYGFRADIAWVGVQRRDPRPKWRSMMSYCNARNPCPHCGDGKLFVEDDLVRHVADQHPEEAPYETWAELNDA